MKSIIFALGLVAAQATKLRYSQHFALTGAETEEAVGALATEVTDAIMGADADGDNVISDTELYEYFETLDEDDMEEGMMDDVFWNTENHEETEEGDLTLTRDDVLESATDLIKWQLENLSIAASLAHDFMNARYFCTPDSQPYDGNSDGILTQEDLDGIIMIGLNYKRKNEMGFYKPDPKINHS